MRRHLHILLLMALLSPLTAQVAVVNAAIPEEPIDVKRMTSLLLGRITTWNNGAPVVLVFAEDHHADVHLLHVAGRERQVLERAWKRLVFAGNGAMPLTARTAADALHLVATTPGAVVLLDHAPADPRWRVVPLMVVADR